ncbi:MAG: hypothetical protein K8F27_07240 [Sulfuricellaceae bacterium]|nr:hypothetical protein [Sulfuricellaceae bacterium]
MTDTLATAFQALRHAVHDDPALQAHLFALADARDFIAAVRQLALSLGYTLEDEDVRQALHAGRKAWSERRLP